MFKRTRPQWILVDANRSGIQWPGLLPYRGPGCARGYTSFEAAEARRNRIRAHYNATKGQGGPDLLIVMR